jgi:hypothetical protein
MAIREVGDRVFALHYEFLDQQIGVVLGGRDVLVIDSRSTASQAREIAADVRRLTADPVSIVVNGRSTPGVAPSTTRSPRPRSAGARRGTPSNARSRS